MVERRKVCSLTSNHIKIAKIKESSSSSLRLSRVFLKSGGLVVVGGRSPVRYSSHNPLSLFLSFGSFQFFSSRIPAGRLEAMSSSWKHYFQWLAFCHSLTRRRWRTLVLVLDTGLVRSSRRFSVSLCFTLNVLEVHAPSSSRNVLHRELLRYLRFLMDCSRQLLIQELSNRVKLNREVHW